MAGLNITLKMGMLCDGTTQKEIDAIKNTYPNKDVIIHWVLPGEASITIYDKEN